MSNVVQFKEKFIKNSNGDALLEHNYPEDNHIQNLPYDIKETFLKTKGCYGNVFIGKEYNDRRKKNKEVSSTMDNDKLLGKYMDSVSQNIRDMEQRNIQDKREREQRITELQRLSEERIEKKFIEAMDAIKNQNKIINAAIDKIDNKYESLKWWILGTAIAIVLSVVSIMK